MRMGDEFGLSGWPSAVDSICFAVGCQRLTQFLRDVTRVSVTESRGRELGSRR